jgi:RNA polymerase sigma factor (sigma-70 family)
MPTNPLNEAILHLRRTLLSGEEAGLTDGQLLACFIDHRDEVALAGIVRRHGTMVWGVCQRILRNQHDAEDAFQAAFLVLVRKAASIVPREMVGNWLYGVARQTALKARATLATRRKRERQAVDMPEPAAADHNIWHDLQPLLDQELGCLPDKYRVPVVMCDLEGKTRKEAAQQLSCPEGTVAGRLARARTMLAKRLARRGVVLSAGGLAAELSQHATAAGVPPALVVSTIKAATLFAAGPAAAAGVVPAQVAALTEGVLQAMFLTKLKKMAAVILVFGLIAFSGGLFAYHQGAGQPAPAGDLPARPEVQPKAGGEQPKAKAGENAKIQALLKERLATLQDVARQLEMVFKEGRIGFEDVVRAKLEVNKAELDLCATDQERIKVLEDRVAFAKDIENVVEAIVQAGKIQSFESLKARAYRLEAEIALERAKVKAAAAPK